MRYLILLFAFYFISPTFAQAHDLSFYVTNKSGQSQKVSVNNYSCHGLEYSHWYTSASGENVHKFYTATSPICPKNQWLVQVMSPGKAELSWAKLVSGLSSCSAVEIVLFDKGINPKVKCYR